MLFFTFALLSSFLCGAWGTSAPTRSPTTATPTRSPTSASPSISASPTYGLGSYDLTTGLPLNKYWMETGFVYMNNYQWKTVTTTVNTFVKPLVFISIPPVAGATNKDGYPTSARISSISTSAGKVTFTSKVCILNLC